MRLPATLSQLVWGSLGAERPYGVHVTGDPFAALAPGLHNDLSRGVFRRLYSTRLLRQTAGACAVAYVTSEFLQRTYPPPCKVFSTYFSNVLLPCGAFVPAPREAQKRENPFRIVMVGSLANLIKRPDVLIDSVGICLQAGLEVQAVIVGDGKCRAKMEARCRTMGLQDKVGFTGQLSSAGEVRHQLDQADLFVLSSETEGMPRAMLEAMARGLPCIGTAVGGIPELLSPGELVVAGDAHALARKILEVSADPERLARMSRGCLETAQAYRDVEVSQRRNAYCDALRRGTERWLSIRRH
jgi:glycosyltransferase involved in cell wall biosynthesis